MNNKLDPSKFVGKGNVGNERVWNVRGLNKAVKQKEVIDVIRSNNKTFGQWDWVSNNSSCEAGTRIIVGWNPRLFDVMVISQSRQVIHCYVRSCNSNYSMYFSFIYAASNYLERRLLWDNLKKHILVVKKEAWGILGDFNVALKPSEYSEGCSKTPKGVDDFIDYINLIEVEDLNCSGFQFTWNKTPTGNKGLLKKLYRVIVNLKFVLDQPKPHAVFKPYRVSDHCPAILNVPVGKLRGKPSFWFANFITEKEEFLPLVEEILDSNIDGFFMFKVCQKLKILKKYCRELCNKHRGSGKRIQELRKELEGKQADIDLNPFDCKIREEHANIFFEFNVACNDEEKLLYQRSKINWLLEGDNNTKFFHRVVKSRGNRNRILMVLDEDGRWVSGKAMKDKFVTHFNKFLGCEDVTEFCCFNDGFFHNKLDSRVALNMIRVVTDEEIKVAMFDIDDNRALVQMGSPPNFLKVLGTLLGWSLGDIVSKNQSAFIPGRSILDNILLAQELIVGSKNKRGVPKCTIKIDIQNAYDKVDWKFLKRILLGNGNSARVIRDALDEFKKVSGLKVSMEKSQIFFSCVKPNIRRIILGILPFDIGKFPFKYLGIPMSVTKLFGRDCKQLIEKIKMRVFNWKSKALSFAGRLQLINSVLTSIHVYWASILSFLWANGEIVKGKAKVKWNDICRPKAYGGLGVKNLRKWNDALLAKHVWNVINNKNSLWVRWMKTNYISDRNFWDILQKKIMSWTWKRFLEVRKIVRPHIVSCVGNGMNNSLWHDWWHSIGIFCSIISRRDWVSNGFSDTSIVNDVLVNDIYIWPVEWVNKFPGLKDAPMFCIKPN
ncbi:uncharacterized protein LOC111901263 [Lactuca sativa]|uniref:uncharacterized protein LOC111901263 n=1 Tax=Lactuca sativa TaxID=4236 RepID=UPI000CD92E1C|nr:uncharacterized protein LOC111901263 [Lactuca sativa]